MLEEFNVTGISTTISASFGLICSLWIFKLSYNSPTYFNRGVGRLILSMAALDAIFSIAAIGSTRFKDSPNLCAVQGGLIYFSGLAGSLMICRLCTMVFATVVCSVKVEKTSKYFLVVAFAFPLAIAIGVNYLHPEDNFYGPGGLWCFISKTHLERYITHYYVFLWATFLLSFICFGMSWYHLHRSGRLQGRRYRKNRHRLMALRLCMSYLIVCVIVTLPRTINIVVRGKDKNFVIWDIFYGTICSGDGWLRFLAWLNTYYYAEIRASASTLYYKMCGPSLESDGEEGKIDKVLQDLAPFVKIQKPKSAKMKQSSLTGLPLVSLKDKEMLSFVYGLDFYDDDDYSCLSDCDS
jgi:Serpentine type 7TM GPCR chemoreceptor Srv